MWLILIMRVHAQQESALKMTKSELLRAIACACAYFDPKKLLAFNVQDKGFHLSP